jgi:hypothetical protein
LCDARETEEVEVAFEAWVQELVIETLKLTLFRKLLAFKLEPLEFLLLRLMLARLLKFPKLLRVRLLRLARLEILRFPKLPKLLKLLIVARLERLDPLVQEVLQPLFMLLLFVPNKFKPRGERNIFWLFPGKTLIKDVPAGSFPAAIIALVMSDPRKKLDVFVDEDVDVAEV